jgi:hypothetical protein
MIIVCPRVEYFDLFPNFQIVQAHKGYGKFGAHGMLLLPVNIPILWGKYKGVFSAFPRACCILRALYLRRILFTVMSSLFTYRFCLRGGSLLQRTAGFPRCHGLSAYWREPPAREKPHAKHTILPEKPVLTQLNAQAGVKT